jgi:hypothetical protein
VDAKSAQAGQSDLATWNFADETTPAYQRWKGISQRNAHSFTMVGGKKSARGISSSICIFKNSIFNYRKSQEYIAELEKEKNSYLIQYTIKNNYFTS